MAIENGDLYRNLLDWLEVAWASRGMSLAAATGRHASAFPRWQQTRERVPVQEFVAVLTAASGHQSDGCFGLDARKIPLDSHSLMVEALLGCAHFGAACEMSARFYGVLLEGLECQYRNEGEYLAMVMTPRTNMATHPFLIDYLLFSWHRTLSWIVGLLVPVQSLEIPLALMLPGPGLASLVRAKQRSDTGRVAMLISRDYVNLPLVRTAAGWRVHVADVRAGILHWPVDDGSISATVRGILRYSLDSGCLHHSLDTMAAELGVSSATLRRKLQAEGGSYQHLLDEFRRSVAIDRLFSQGQTVAEVASLLGYSEPRSFTRAFKTWTGYPPSAYEQGAGQQSH